MKTLTLKTLKIKNFKGIKSFEFKPHSMDAAIHGENGTGKSSVWDAFTWMLFGKDSSDRTDFQLKPVGTDGAELHNLDTEVEANLDINGKTIVLLRGMREKWTKKRGSARTSFTGNTFYFSIDEVPAKKGDYEKKISEIIDIKVFKLLTSPFEFNNMHWSDRRQLLLEMCGDVSDQGVIDSDKELSALVDVLKECSLEDHKKKVQQKKKKINNEIGQIPVRIDELSASIKDADKPDPKEKAALDKKLKEEKEVLRQSQTNEALSVKRVRLNEINAAILDAKNKATAQVQEQRKPIQDEIDALESARQETNRQISDLEYAIKTNQDNNKAKEDALKQLRAEWHRVNDEALPAIETECPYCGQDMPEEKIQEAMDKYRLDKAKKLGKINDDGKQLSKTIEVQENDISRDQGKSSELKAKVSDIMKQIKKKQAELKAVDAPVDVEKLNSEKISVEAEINAIMDGSSSNEKEILQRIKNVEESIEAWAEKEASWKSAEKSRARINELEAREKTLAVEYEKLEKDLYLIEKFVVAKVGMLEGKINSRFENTSFKLFNELINSGIEETCITTYNGVGWTTLNSAARVQVGIDIISTLSEYYGFAAPIWIDNREGVTWIPETKAQTISLVVDPGYKKLEVSTKSEEVAA